MVKIHLNLSLIEYTKAKYIEIELEHDTPLLDILKQIGVPPDEVGIIIKNGRWAPKSSIVSNNDTIELFPQLSGG